MRLLSDRYNEADTPFPVAVGALLINVRGEVLSISRKTDPTDFGIVGGKVEPGETEAQAMVRELREETGLEAKRYHRIFALVETGGYWFITFFVTHWEGGEPHGLEGAVCLWLPPLRLLQLSCSFREYNRVLFSFLGLLPPAMP